MMKKAVLSLGAGVAGITGIGVVEVGFGFIARAAICAVTGYGAVAVIGISAILYGIKKLIDAKHVKERSELIS